MKALQKINFRAPIGFNLPATLESFFLSPLYRWTGIGKQGGSMARLARALPDHEAYAMANLRPAETGLPMVVWAVSAHRHARQDVWVKVCRVPGLVPSGFGNAVSVAVRPEPHLKPPGQAMGALTASDLQAVYDWITLNRAALVDYWDSAISTAELHQRLRHLSCSLSPAAS
jgi:hypothetical protein